MAPSGAGLRIGALARAAGVPVSTVRFYERRRLVVPSTRTSGNYRLYAEGDAERVQFIQRAKALGFSLADIGALLAFSSSGQVLRRADLERVAGRKLSDLDDRIARLRRVRRALVGLLAQPCVDPAEPCPIVRSLVAPARASRR